MNKVSLYLSPKQVKHMIMGLADLPQEYDFNTMNGRLEIIISQEKNLLEKAKLQEFLRERFSLPERMENNQQIIKTYTKSS
jgi:hypothetical protein